ncbi:MAG TPA: DUF1343 domain-containing protein [Gemmatimonadaceae bacterium]|nr:DUF1343 domain-containing protein [Gemmatimonadaceae bacterium]
MKSTGRRPLRPWLFALAGVAIACLASRPADTRVLPGITILLRDSLEQLKGKRVALVTNQTGINEKGESDIDLLHAALPARGAHLTALFSPEHGIRGTEDRSDIENDRDSKTGLPIYSLFTSQAVPPPDSLLRDVDAIVFDLFDIGTRTWTYVGTMLYTMRSAARRGIPIYVLDRPNPLGGRAEGPMLDAALANANDPAPGKPGRAFALVPAPLRHGLTMGEMARWFNDELGVGADLHVIQMSGWRRSLWWDSTGIPWVKPSPNIPSLTSALLYPALVPLEGSNVSVGRGTPTAFQRFGAPWMNAQAVAQLLESRSITGVRFVVDPFTPDHPGDDKYGGRRIPGVRIDVVARERLQAARVGATIVWALHKLHPDSLRLANETFDQRMGADEVREALLAGTDPDVVIDREVLMVSTWLQKIRKYLLYR